MGVAGPGRRLALPARVRSLVLGLALMSCVDQPWVSEPVDTARVVRVEHALVPPKSYDLLFVIDTSPAMQPHVENLARNLPNLINVLDTVTGGRPSVHIAVTTSDPADDGAFHDPNGLDDFLIDERRPNGTRLDNFEGSLVDAFTAAATLEPGGARSQPLAMARRALLRHPEFLRERAYLSVIVITPQDDASPQSLGVLEAFFKSAKADDEQVIVAAATGLRERPCEFEGAVATASPRLLAFLDRFPGRSTVTAICQQDLSGVLQQFAELLKTIIHDPCIEVPFREETCTAWLDFEDRPSEVLGRCEDGLGPCFAIEHDPETCPGGSQHKVTYGHSLDATHFTMECEVEQVTEIVEP